MTDDTERDTRWYSLDEKRVCNYLQKITDGQVGCGPDPVGFLIASHEMFRHERDDARALAAELEERVAWLRDDVNRTTHARLDAQRERHEALRSRDCAIETQNEAVRLMVAAEQRAMSAEGKLAELKLELERLNAFLPFAWAINDSLRIDGDTTTFEGSQNAVEDFRARLHRVDPNFDRGIKTEEE